MRKLRDAFAAVDVAGDRTEIRLQRRLQFTMAVVSIPTIGLWGVMLLASGHLGAALFPFGYVAATIVLLAALAATGDFRILRVPHTLIVAALPVGLSIYLGGFAQSGGAMLWSMLVPFAATMFTLPGRRLWFIGVVAAAVAVYLTGRPEAATLSRREIELHFAFNIIGFTAFLFISVRHFVSRIDAEKARAEQLLHRVLPAPIVRRLKREPGVIADHLDGVTVVFADLVGFTAMAAQRSPAEVVSLLDDIFSRFDALAATFGVEKIKTIGDAYMAVAGAPEPCADHAQRAARLALAMRDLVAELAATRDVALSMRIGLHTGEAVAGVIGIERFAYDLWGDTVNTASRMESHGQPGSIQITQATRDALGSAFQSRERGAIEVKGRGTLTTFWLDG